MNDAKITVGKRDVVCTICLCLIPKGSKRVSFAGAYHTHVVNRHAHPDCMKESIVDTRDNMEAIIQEMGWYAPGKKFERYYKLLTKVIAEMHERHPKNGEIYEGMMGLQIPDTGDDIADYEKALKAAEDRYDRCLKQYG